MIKVTAPKYRKSTYYERAVCPKCGVECLRGDPSSSRQHRRAHKEVMHYLDPKPLKKMSDELGSNSDVEVVNLSSPLFKHKENYRRARESRK